MFFLFPYLTPKLFCLLCIPLIFCPHAFSHYLLVEFCSLHWEYLVLFVLLDSVSVSFKSAFLQQYILICLFKLRYRTSLLFCFSLRQWSRRPGFNPRSNYTKDTKMVLDAALLSTQHYKVRIKGIVEQSRE